MPPERREEEESFFTNYNKNPQISSAVTIKTIVRTCTINNIKAINPAHTGAYPHRYVHMHANHTRSHTFTHKPTSTLTTTHLHTSAIIVSTIKHIYAFQNNQISK